MNSTPIISPPPHPRPLDRWLKYISYGIIVILIAVGTQFLYWSIQNPSILVVNNAPFPVRPSVITPDGIEIMTVDYCKFGHSKGEVLARLVGKKSIIRIPWPKEEQSAQCLKTDAPILIPSYATDDEYYFDFVVTYKINPIKEKTVTFRSQPFTVKSKLMIQ